MQNTTVTVAEDQAGQRLDRFLAGALDVSRARVRHLLEVGRVRLADRALSRLLKKDWPRTLEELETRRGN